ncbi:MAG: tetratricopeptide repeat protein [Chloroflexi bacterium]|nr:tetratricopeptide repeat protein [Chloroflexota bacterium]
MRPFGHLEALLDAVVAVKGREAPLALVFLTRQAPTSPEDPTRRSPFYEDLRQWSIRGVEHLCSLLVEDMAPRSIPSLKEAERRELFDVAVNAFRRRLAVGEDVPRVEYEDDALPRRPLALILLAFLAAQGHRVLDSRDEEAIYQNVWDWERDKWARILDQIARGSLDGHLVQMAQARVEQALVAATLGRPFFTPEEVAAFWERCPPVGVRHPRRETLDLPWLAQQVPYIVPSLPAEERFWPSSLLSPVAPDPLADFVLARCKDLAALTRAILPTPGKMEAVFQRLKVSSRPPEILAVGAQDIVPLLWPLITAREVLPRLCDAYPEAARAVAGTLAAWLEETARELDAHNPEAARDWMETWRANLPDHPERTLAHREMLVGLYQAFLAVTRDEAEQARWRSNLGVALSALGRREAALQATEEAVKIRRDLARRNPDAFLPDLAMSLNNLGNRLSELGRREAALRATEEAVERYRDLACRNPDAFLPYLATSLNNLGDRLSELDRSKEALRAYEQAVRILAPFFVRLPAAFVRRMAYMTRDYLEACRAAGQEPDEELLAPAVEVLQKLSGEDAP